MNICLISIECVVFLLGKEEKECLVYNQIRRDTFVTNCIELVRYHPRFRVTTMAPGTHYPIPEQCLATNLKTSLPDCPKNTSNQPSPMSNLRQLPPASQSLYSNSTGHKFPSSDCDSVSKWSFSIHRFGEIHSDDNISLEQSLLVQRFQEHPSKSNFYSEILVLCSKIKRYSIKEYFSPRILSLAVQRFEEHPSNIHFQFKESKNTSQKILFSLKYLLSIQRFEKIPSKKTFSLEHSLFVQRFEEYPPENIFALKHSL